jgi:hypothetical protein
MLICTRNIVVIEEISARRRGEALRSSLSAQPASSHQRDQALFQHPARIRLSTWSFVRRSSTTLSMPFPCRSCDNRRPEGPPPMIGHLLAFVI